jgi:flagellar assembly protein FliH
MTTQPVASARIRRGSYRADATQPAMVRILPDARRLELEADIRRLTTELDIIRRQGIPDAEARAREEGLATGYQKGMTECKAPLDEAAQLMRTLAREMETGFEDVWNRSREGMMRLSLAIAGKIVGDAAQRYEPLTAELAGRCLRMVRDQARVVVAVNPADAEQLRIAQTRLQSLGEGIKYLEIVERQSVPRGGVLVETDLGQLDARLEEQFQTMEAVLLPKWSRPATEE